MQTKMYPHKLKVKVLTLLAVVEHAFSPSTWKAEVGVVVVVVIGVVVVLGVVVVAVVSTGSFVPFQKCLVHENAFLFR